MLQAATTGAMDFSRIDPRDRWWWRKLHWTLQTLETQRLRTYHEARHRHWVTIFANPSLDQSSFSNAKDYAFTHLQKVVQLLFPWHDWDEHEGESHDIISDFREMYGYPGDPRYEQMLRDAVAAFAKLSKP